MPPILIDNHNEKELNMGWTQIASLRSSGSTRHGRDFDVGTVEQVWRKATIVPGYDATTYRKDCCGAWIQKLSYGSKGDYGWEIDHIRPVAKGGGDNLENLQPLHWKNNRHKSDDWPEWSCALRAA